MKLLLVIHSMAGDTNSIVSATDRKIDNVLKLLRRRTDFEIELTEFIESNGGIKNSINNDEFMRRLIRKFEGSAESSAPQSQGAPEPPPRTSYAGYSPFSPQRRGSAGSVYDPSSYSQGPYQTAPGTSSAAPYAPTTPYAPYAPDPYTSAYSSFNYLQRRPSYSRPGSAPYAPYSPPTSSMASTWGSASSPPSTSAPQYTSSYPSTSSTTWRPSTNSSSAYSQNGPGRYSTSALDPATIPSSQATTPYSAQRTAMRTSVATRPLEEDVVDVTGSVKPMLLEHYRNEIQYALMTGLNAMIRRNEQVWTFKLRHLTNDIKHHIDYGTNKMLRAITGGPHERIKHPKLRAIWEMEVRGSCSFPTPCITDARIYRRNGEVLLAGCSFCKQFRISWSTNHNIQLQSHCLKYGRSNFLEWPIAFLYFKPSIATVAGLSA